MLKELVDVVNDNIQVRASFRASEVGEPCETFLCHVLLGHKPLPNPGRLERLFEDGHYHERDVATRLVEQGFDVQHSCLTGQMELLGLDNPRVPGHPDGVIDLHGRPIELDWADENFKLNPPNRIQLLEITAPNHNTFMRLLRDHLKEVIPRKYVQMQMYLNSDKLKPLTDSGVCIVKSKNTSALYEEGVSFDPQVIEDTREKLKRVEAQALTGTIGDFRCDDWRVRACKYNHLCFAEESSRPEPMQGMLKGEDLNEASIIKDAAFMNLVGKLCKQYGTQLIDESRGIFDDLLLDYEAAGMTVSEDLPREVRAIMVESRKRSTDFDKLEAHYFEAYSACVRTGKSTYVRVT